MEHATTTTTTTTTGTMEPNKKEDDKDDDCLFNEWKMNPKKHEEALLQMAWNPRGNHCMKRCIDPNQRREQSDYYSGLEIVAFDILQCCIVNHCHQEEEEEDNKKEKGQEEEKIKEKEEEEDNNNNMQTPLLLFFQSSMDQAKEIWGPHVLQELLKKTPEELEAEREDRLNDTTSPVIESQEVEEGEWWGPVTQDDPMPAYEQLIDAARCGTMMVCKNTVHALVPLPI